MTHDELLEEVNEASIENLRTILTFLVQEHKPVQLRSGDIGCMYCSSTFIEPYPCPFIQATEEQMK